MSHGGTYTNPGNSASTPIGSHANKCGLLQNDAGTRSEKWHKTDTSGSQDVPALTVAEYVSELRACGAELVATSATEHSAAGLWIGFIDVQDNDRFWQAQSRFNLSTLTTKEVCDFLRAEGGAA